MKHSHMSPRQVDTSSQTWHIIPLSMIDHCKREPTFDTFFHPLLCVCVLCRAVKNTSASFPSLFSCLNPFFTGFLSFMILGETMRGASDAIGLMFNVAGTQTHP